MKTDQGDLTPQISTLCSPMEYCYWNGEERFAPPDDAGYVWTNKHQFALQVYGDYPNGLPEPKISGYAYEHGEGCVIGGKGFGWTTSAGGYPLRFPHIGGVFIGQGVELGSNVTIDRGAIGQTILLSDVKVDNGVHVGHNAVIGQRTLVTAHAVIGGSVVIGMDCWIGLGAIIKEHITIGSNVTIGMGAIVLKDVPSGETWVGNPARKLR